MKVKLAMALFSRAVSDGLKYLVSKEGFSEELLTTATFIEVMARWFDLVNSRHHGIALSKKNIDQYNKAIDHLKEVQDLFLNMYVLSIWFHYYQQ